MTEEKNRIESSVGCVKTEARMSEAIGFIMSDSVRNQDKDSALISMAYAGKLQRDFVLRYTFEHIEERGLSNRSLFARFGQCERSERVRTERTTNMVRASLF